MVEEEEQRSGGERRKGKPVRENQQDERPMNWRRYVRPLPVFTRALLEHKPANSKCILCHNS